MTDAERIADRLWAAFVISHTPEVAESILCGFPGSRRLPRRRGFAPCAPRWPAPNPDEYLLVSEEMLAAVVEAGPIPTTRRKRR